MLFVGFLLFGLAAATRVCYEAPENLFIPSCTDTCLGTDTSILDGVCADNLKGICELDGGVASFFRVYTRCLSQSCTATTSRERLVEVFQKQCGWFNDISDEQARYFGEWQVYLRRSSATSQDMSTGNQRSTSNVVATSTRVGGGVAVSSDVFTEPLTSTQAMLHTTSATSSSIETISDEGPSSTPPNDNFATPVLSDKLSSTSRTSQTSSATGAHKPTSSASEESGPVLSTAALAGLSVGGICLLTIGFGAVVLVLRRRRRKQPKEPRSMSPPIFRSDTGNIANEKAALARQQAEPQSPVSRMDVPAGVVELDGGSPVSPVWEPVHVSTSERRAKVAQNL